MAAALVSSEMVNGRFALNRRVRIASGVLVHTPGKGFHRGGQFHTTVAAYLGGLMHAVDGVAIVRGNCLRDRHGR